MTPEPSFEDSPVASWPRSRLLWVEFAILGILPLLALAAAKPEDQVELQPWFTSLEVIPGSLGILGLIVYVTWWSGTPLRHIGLSPKWNRQTTEAVALTTLAGLVLWWVPCHALHLFPTAEQAPFLPVDIVAHLVRLASQALLIGVWVGYNWNRASELMLKPYAFLLLVGLNSLSGFWDSPLHAAMLGVLSAVLYASIIRWRSAIGVAIAMMVAYCMPLLIR